MKLEVVEHRKNPLMKREEVLFSVDHGGRATPSRADLLKEVARKVKAKEDLVIIDRIFTSTGDSRSSLRVLVYKKANDIPKGKIEKMKTRMEKKKKPTGEAKPEGKPEEKKAEETEVREETKEEKAEGEKKEGEKE